MYPWRLNIQQIRGVAINKKTCHLNTIVQSVIIWNIQIHRFQTYIPIRLSFQILHFLHMDYVCKRCGTSCRSSRGVGKNFNLCERCKVGVILMVQSFVDMFNQLKTVHCMCPNCDNLMRVSDLKLISKEKTDKTWLDTLDVKTKKIDTKEEKFAEEEGKIREESRKRGREQVPKLINQSLNKNFLKLKYDPYDVKAILHPIDFVAFDGMNEGQVNNVTLLSNKTKNPHLQNIHKAIAEAVKTKSYDWKILHVAEDGVVTYK